MIRLRSLDPDLYYLAGLIDQARDRVTTAEEFFLKAAYLNPKHYESLVHLSLLAERKGDSQRSKQYRERARRLRSAAEMEEESELSTEK